MTFIYFIDNTTSTYRVITGLGMYVENNLKKVDENTIDDQWIMSLVKCGSFVVGNRLMLKKYAFFVP
jgi:hypothetical protein